MHPYPSHQSPQFDAPWEVTIGADEYTRLKAIEGKYQTLTLGMVEGHVAEFRADGWTIQHPLTCRLSGKSLFECPFNRSLELSRIPAFGCFQITLEDEVLVVGDKVTP